MKRVLAGGATVAFVGQRINFGVTALRTKNFSLAPAIFQEIAPRSGLTSRMAFVLYEIHIAFPVLYFLDTRSIPRWRTCGARPRRPFPVDDREFRIPMVCLPWPAEQP